MASFLDTLRRPAVAPTRPDLPRWPTPGGTPAPSPPGVPTGGRPMAPGSPFGNPGYRPPSGWRFGDPLPGGSHPAPASNPAVTPPPAPAPGATDPFGGRPAQLFKTKFQDALLGTGYVPPAVLQEIMSYWDQHMTDPGGLNQASIGGYGTGLGADALAILKKAFGSKLTPAQEMAQNAPGMWASMQPGYQQEPNWTSAGIPTNAAAMAYDKEHGVRPWGNAGMANQAASDALMQQQTPTYPDGSPIPATEAPPAGAPQTPTQEQVASHRPNEGYWQFNATTGQWQWVPFPPGSGG